MPRTSVTSRASSRKVSAMRVARRGSPGSRMSGAKSPSAAEMCGVGILASLALVLRRAPRKVRAPAWPSLGARTPRSAQVEPVQFGDLGPGRDKVAHELLRGVVARIDLGQGAQLGIRAEQQIDTRAAAHQLIRALLAAFERLRAWIQRLPGGAELQERDKELVAQHARTVGEDAIGRTVPVGAEYAQTAHEHGHLRRAQGEQVGLVHQLVLLRKRGERAVVVAEPIGNGLQVAERLDVGLLLRRIGPAGVEGHLDVEAAILGGLLDARVARQHQQVREGDLLAAGLSSINLGTIKRGLDALEHGDHLGKLLGIVDRPAPLRFEANACAVDAAALVAATERGCRSPCCLLYT